MEKTIKKKKTVEVVDPKVYVKNATEWIKDNNLKQGDRVRILRVPKRKEGGWTNSLGHNMKNYVGFLLEVNQVRTDARGIYLSDGCCWPYFVLEKVDINKDNWTECLTHRNWVYSKTDGENRKSGKKYRITHVDGKRIWFRNEDGMVVCSEKTDEFELVMEKGKPFTGGW